MLIFKNESVESISVPHSPTHSCCSTIYNMLSVFFLKDLRFMNNRHIPHNLLRHITRQSTMISAIIHIRHCCLIDAFSVIGGITGTFACTDTCERSSNTGCSSAQYSSLLIRFLVVVWRVLIPGGVAAKVCACDLRIGSLKRCDA